MRLTKIILPLLLLIPWSLDLSSREIALPCAEDANPIVCSFLDRYIENALNWNNQELLLSEKMRDDKFLVLEGDLENVTSFNDSTICTIVRYDDKAYEVIWNQNGVVRLRVAFPIQYELLLGKPRLVIEQEMQTLIESAYNSEKDDSRQIEIDSIGNNVFCTTPIKHYQLLALNNCSYFYKDSIGLKYIADTSLMPYTIANIFQNGLDMDCQLNIEQQVYGFKKLCYNVSLKQWLLYCNQMGFTTYVAIEEEGVDYIKALVIVECLDLGFNHLMSVMVPRSILTDSTKVIAAKLNAFIPTHNVADLFDQFKETPKKKIEWEK